MGRKTKSTFRMAGYSYPGRSPVKSAKMRRMDAAARQQSIQGDMAELGKEDYAATNIKEWQSGVKPTMDINPITYKNSPAKAGWLAGVWEGVKGAFTEGAKKVGEETVKTTAQKVGESLATSAVSSGVGMGMQEAFRNKKKDRRNTQASTFGGGQIGGGSSQIV